MSIIRRLLPQSDEQRSFRAPIDWSDLVGPTTTSGQVVTPENAARSAAVTACQRVLTSTIASLPVDVVRPVGNRRIPIDAPPVVAGPSASVRRRTFVAQTVKSMVSDGNGYWRIVGTDADANPTQLESVHYRDVRWSRPDGPRLRPHIDNEAIELYPTGPLVHIPSSPFIQPGSPVADSPVELARQAIGTGLAAEEFGARFFGDGYHPTVVAESDTELTEQQAKAIKTAINKMRATREPGVFGSGLSLTFPEINPEDSQFIDLMRFEVEQACRFFGVPPSMAYAAVSGQNVTYANVTSSDLQYLKHSVGIWLLDIEDAWSELLPADLTVRFNVDALLRMDAEARHKVYANRLVHKTMSANEVRALEDEEPFDDPDFDEPGVPGGVPGAPQEAQQ